ncbi:MAG: hypothetical protein COB61_002910 [Thiotrichales bacterium]|nr:hypothetical protein [Thiotrichales bacterium]
MNVINWHKVWIIVCIVILSGCTSEADVWRANIDKAERKIDQQLRSLSQHMDSGNIRNAILIKEYAYKVRDLKPDLNKITSLLEKEGSARGSIYKGIVDRFNTAKASKVEAVSSGTEAVNNLGREYQSIYVAASAAQFGNMLIDPINTLASMSDGVLPALPIPGSGSSADQKENDYGPGGNLVGNPHYGQWQTNSSGSSFWAFYGQYAFFSSLFRGPVYYGNWSSGRNRSYYHDVGRDTYTSPKQRQSQAQVEQRTRKKFQADKKPFKSAYGKNTSTPKTVTKSPNKFKSAYGKSSQSSSFSNKSGTRSSSSFGSSKSSSFYNSRSSSFRGGGK